MGSMLPYMAAPWILWVVNYTFRLFNIAMEHHHAIENGKPSISMDHLYPGYVSHNQMVICSEIVIPF